MVTMDNNEGLNQVSLESAGLGGRADTDTGGVLNSTINRPPLQLSCSIVPGCNRLMLISVVGLMEFSDELSERLISVSAAAL